MSGLTIAAPAKINLGLEVRGRRADGYHEIVTIFQALEFGDTVHLTPAPTIRGESAVDGLDAGSDLAFRAAYELQERIGTTGGVHISIDKRIPVAAGLAGGSTDAAAVLLGLRRLWNADASTTAESARALGADIPFFLHPGTALGLARGDDLRPMPPAPMRWVLLVRPHAEISARDAYAELRPPEWSGGSATLQQVDGLRDGDFMPQLLINDLQPAAIRLVPEVAQVLRALESAGAEPALLAGSGPTCFGLFPTRAAARNAESRVGSHGWWTQTTRFMTPPDDAASQL
ncbi:MAG: 4-(cytidine 5'-diphospho)-2-C-methyl-D-erythritol kinase [Chloroflexi bacterium]|nr:4-(cytidine 5'-diphospho)-2-C-methyl-D-erythritol kinase [Chloroflexota bacterium]MCY3959755.1 4-(cytidine 5'-diphospho)-2-C-methyl-D-erythritol kinase [Chloroflexota bacterium]